MDPNTIVAALDDEITTVHQRTPPRGVRQVITQREDLERAAT